MTVKPESNTEVQVLIVGVYGWTRHELESVFRAIDVQSGSIDLRAFVPGGNTHEPPAMDWRREQRLWEGITGEILQGFVVGGCNLACPESLCCYNIWVLGVEKEVWKKHSREYGPDKIFGAQK